MLRKTVIILFASFLISVQAVKADETYSEDSVIDDAADFFGEGAEGVAEVIEKIFKDQGKPNAVIKRPAVRWALAPAMATVRFISSPVAVARYIGPAPPLVSMPVVTFPRYTSWFTTCQTQMH